MLTALALGAGLGLGLWTLAVWLVPPRPTLGALLARASAPQPPPSPAVDAHAFARPVVVALHAAGLPGERLTRDLTVLQRPVAAHLATKVAYAVAGLLAPLALHVVLVVTELPVTIELSALTALALAVAGFLLPDLQVRSAARRARAAFRHALSAYLDLVWITLAGGAGVDSALTDAATIGRGWAFEQIRHALETARLTRIPPWTALRQLGGDLAVTELVELAASVSLAGSEGAKVRASLATKAAALRAHQITDAEADAQSATERMSLPVVALFLGYLGFIAYPALTHVLNGL
ncbi:type II secretion system F family protein [Allokutzneria sp. A3M-2-11 16]|uniref:type II secretion system F family protein n=1 Tax=Allokutzneria sp. A3M-2-11 16 TaxID=2962043 RepID=UPI0020B77FE6|nr:type II secretion system F family protein [Allokutzneria sp. A3M-2-11 16]MCP3800701.1 type II secretion system F family protein [Allokutzneria sp. A3M-2-11 16]